MAFWSWLTSFPLPNPTTVTFKLSSSNLSSIAMAAPWSAPSSVIKMANFTASSWCLTTVFTASSWPPWVVNWILHVAIFVSHNSAHLSVVKIACFVIKTPKHFASQMLFRIVTIGTILSVSGPTAIFWRNVDAIFPGVNATQINNRIAFSIFFLPYASPEVVLWYHNDVLWLFN